MRPRVHRTNPVRLAFYRQQFIISKPDVSVKDFLKEKSACMSAILCTGRAAAKSDKIAAAAMVIYPILSFPIGFYFLERRLFVF